MPQISAILLVDDDPSTNFLNESTLYELRLTEKYLTASNGEEALRMLQECSVSATPEQPVLVLLDMAMPVMNGMEFLEAFHDLPQAVQQATVIVILAMSMPSGDLARLEDYPIAGMVSKPLTKEKITTVMQLYFSQQNR
ncbi:response regulator [Hymenobacter endophyticus]|uniref:Response regulator n=1 Tax=Hymenobacter endophyticus TaxID=3076335 RepID=A0ABU3TD27_9BACT|nr:response regulator [Hymenobacter endophyticus]MDU0369268.1 response regulator [Hymenobacter endophyticus]